MRPARLARTGRPQQPGAALRPRPSHAFPGLRPKHDFAASGGLRRGGDGRDLRGADQESALEEAELGLLLTKMQDEPVDLHELYQLIRQKLNELKAFGMPLPADLVQFEHDLEAEFAADKEDSERRTRLDEVVRQRATR
jgi:hypothetical protein